MNNYTHKAVVTIYSTQDSPEVFMEVQWEPTLEGKDIEDQGYIPAAYKFMQQVIELAAVSGEYGALLDEEDVAEYRTLN